MADPDLQLDLFGFKPVTAVTRVRVREEPRARAVQPQLFYAPIKKKRKCANPTCSVDISRTPLQRKWCSDKCAYAVNGHVNPSAAAPIIQIQDLTNIKLPKYVITRVSGERLYVYVQKSLDRDRHRVCKRVRIFAIPGTPEFDSAYKLALMELDKKFNRPKRTCANAECLADLTYRDAKAKYCSDRCAQRVRHTGMIRDPISKDFKEIPKRQIDWKEAYRKRREQKPLLPPPVKTCANPLCQKEFQTTATHRKQKYCSKRCLRNDPKNSEAAKQRTREWYNNNLHARAKKRGIDLSTMPQKPEKCENPYCNNTKLHVDHDHSNGKFRGWLCYLCNPALGMAQDNPAILRWLADYLERHSQAQTVGEIVGQPPPQPSHPQEP